MIKNFTDHAANERTYLAWVRTSIATLTLGFLIEKFDLFLDEMAKMSGQQPVSDHSAGTWLAVSMACMSLLISVMATYRFWRNRKDILKSETIEPGRTVEIFTLSMLSILLGVLLVGYLVTRAN